MNIVEELIAVLGYEIKGEENLKKFQKNLDVAANNVQKLSRKIVRHGAVAERGFLRAADATIVFGEKVSAVGASLTKLSAISAAIFTAGAFGLNKFSKEASNLEESINAVNVVFGSASDNILEFSKSSAKTVGLASSEFNQLSTETGALLSRTGEPLDEVANLTKDLTVRAADLASVYNTDVKLALSAINQALRGETEAIRKYAADVTDASLQNFLMSEGINKKVKTLTQEEKTLFRLKLLMKQTDVVSGDFKKTIDSQANSQRVLNATWKNAQATLGQSVLPLKAKLAKELTKILDAFNNLSPSAQALISKTLVLSVALAGILALLAPLLFVLGRVISLLGKLAGAIALISKISKGGKALAFLSFFRKNKGVIRLIRGFAKAISFLRIAILALFTPVGAVIAAIVAFGLVVQDLWTFLTGGVSVTGKIVNKLKEFNILKKVSRLFEGAQKSAKQFAEKVWSSFSSRFPKTAKVISVLASNIRDINKSLLKFASSSISSAIDSVINGFSKFKLFAIDVITTIKLAWQSLSDTIANSAVIKTFVSVKDGASSLIDGASEKIGSLASSFGSSVAEKVDNFFSSKLQGVADSSQALKNLTANLNRTNAPTSSNSILSNSNAVTINNEVNVEQNIAQASDAPEKVAQATGRAASRSLGQRAQIEVSPAF